MAQKFTERSKTQKLGFVPLEQRIARIQMAGLNTLISRDRQSAHLYDGYDPDMLPPPLPRHLLPDMADVSELFRYYRARKVEIEERVSKEKAEKAASQMNPDGQPAQNTEPEKAQKST